jgi:hypothetical protein
MRYYSQFAIFLVIIQSITINIFETWKENFVTMAVAVIVDGRYNNGREGTSPHSLLHMNSH